MSPRNRLPPNEQAKGICLARLQASLSIPTSASNASTTAFSLFYTAAVTFPFVVTTTFWLYLFPSSGFSDSMPFWAQFLQYFRIANEAFMNSVTALLEIFVLSSVRKQSVCFYCKF